MPSWTIHLKIANKINQNLKIDNNAFVLGNVMPDIFSGYIITNISNHVDTFISHYKSSEGKHIIGIDKFINNYNKKMKNPVVLGYLTHLISDYFWNSWTYSKHHKEIDGKILMIPTNGNVIETDRETFRLLKHEDLKTFDKYLQNFQYLGPLLKSDKSTYEYAKEILEIPCTLEDINKTFDFLNSIINEKPEYKPNYNIFSEQELNELLDKTCNYIYETLTHNNIIDSNYKIILES